MPLTNNATRMLSAKGIAHQAHAVPTEKLGAMGTAEFLGVDAKRVFKSIVFRNLENGESLLAIVPGDMNADAKALARAAGSKSVKAATQAEAEQLTGLQTGGISALALMNKRFRFFLDESAMEFEAIHISGGERGINISISPQNFIEFCSISLAKIAK
mgnify:CR=1 FL=1